MTAVSLADFLTSLQDVGDLLRIEALVDPLVELAAITDRVIRQSHDGGPALLFAAIRNSSMPVATNLLGHPRRICRAFQVASLDAIPDQFGSVVEEIESRTARGPVAPSRFAPRTIRQALCQQVVKLGRDVNLWELPALRRWPGERNPVFAGLVTVTPDVEMGQMHCSGQPLQLVDRARLQPAWRSDESPLIALQSFRKLQRQMPVAIVCGSDPRLRLWTMAANEWCPRAATYESAGTLRQVPWETVKCRTHDLEVPADAELVIEGLIDPDAEWEPLSPMALESGHYSHERLVPPIQVTAITQRANPVVPASITGSFPSEDGCIRDAVDRLFLPSLKRRLPELTDCWRPAWGHGQVAFFSVRKSRAMAARTVAHGLWGTAGLQRAKLLIAVDDDIDLRREADVWAAVARHTDLQRDALSSLGAVLPDDHAVAQSGIGGQLLIDATRKTSAEGFPRPWPDALKLEGEWSARLAARWPEFGIPEEDKRHDGGR